MNSFLRIVAPFLFAIIPLSSSAIGITLMTIVKLETSQGDIVIELNHEKAPNTVANFLNYVDEGFYNGTIFHRVIKDFMIQGGGFTEEFVQKTPHDPIQNEANNGLSNTAGTIAMARTGNPHSATAQFFINTVDNNFLDFRGEQGAAWGYAVFGKVVKGLDVVDAIRGVSTGNKKGHGDVPNDTITIIKVSRVDNVGAE